MMISSLLSRAASAGGCLVGYPLIILPRRHFGLSTYGLTFYAHSHSSVSMDGYDEKGKSLLWLLGRTL